MSLTAFCTVLFFASVGLFIWRLSRKFSLVGFLLSGCGLAGAIGTMRDTTADMVVSGGGAAISVLTGASVVVALAVFIGLYLWAKLKGGGGGVIAAAIAFMFPTILTLVGLGALVDLVNGGLTTVAALIPIGG